MRVAVLLEQSSAAGGGGESAEQRDKGPWAGSRVRRSNLVDLNLGFTGALGSNKICGSRETSKRTHERPPWYLEWSFAGIFSAIQRCWKPQSSTPSLEIVEVQEI